MANKQANGGQVNKRNRQFSIPRNEIQTEKQTAGNHEMENESTSKQVVSSGKEIKMPIEAHPFKI